MFKKATAIGLMLASAHSFAMQIQSTDLVFQPVEMSGIATAPTPAPIEKETIVADAGCTNVPLNYEEAMMYGFRCN